MPRTTRPATPEVFTPAQLGPLTLRNRIIKAATFEGVMPGGKVSDALIEYHRRVAAGGAAMSTVAYLAVSPEGRTDRHCLLLDDETAKELRGLTDAVHAEGAAAAAQIGHAGPVANARSNRAPALAPSGGFTPMGSRLHAIDAAGIERVVEDYRAAATRAVDAGFDSIEVHVGHNYLLSAFLSPKLNKRKDQFGGSVENRARFARAVLRNVRDAVGDKAAVTAKLNMADGVDGGLWVDESVEVARLFEADGTLDALELTGGSSLANPMYLFRGDAPLAEFGATLPPPVRVAFKFIGHRFLKTYPYEEAFFLPFARQFRATLTTPIILLGGITELATIEAALAEGFAFVAMARALLREPDLPNRMQAGAATSSLCIHCNKCMPTIYSGTRCVLVADRPGSD
ncbi:MAG TPA: NADH:flavin oxidoreductase [Acidimicrobiales bacterium]|jgi:2,4-dienoyl-CoA reductase-like NADH-dependent reductase (Old Yellow Enzyme family)|nr:NADH:flavin oxidoreductase [Acidimicrobiales bacterium]